MTESEYTFTDLLPQFDDPESPDRPDRIIARPAKYSYAVDDEDDDEESLTQGQKMFGIYGKYFTPAELKKYAAIPANDPTHEIKILRKMLFDTFALMPSGPKDKKPPLTPKFQNDLIATLCRAGYVLTRLIALHMKLNPPRQRLQALFDEVIDELDPNDMSTYDWDLT